MFHFIYAAGREHTNYTHALLSLLIFHHCCVCVYKHFEFIFWHSGSKFLHFRAVYKLLPCLLVWGSNVYRHNRLYGTCTRTFESMRMKSKTHLQKKYLTCSLLHVCASFAAVCVCVCVCVCALLLCCLVYKYNTLSEQFSCKYMYMSVHTIDWL